MGESLGATILHGVGANGAIHRQIERLALYHICTNFVPAALLPFRILAELSMHSSGQTNQGGLVRPGPILAALGLALWWLLRDSLDASRDYAATLFAILALAPWWAYATVAQARGVLGGRSLLLALGLACGLVLADWLALCGLALCRGEQLALAWVDRVGSGVLVFLAAFHSWEDRWRSQGIDRDRVESRWLRARLDTLTAQLNPHFLFNTLNAISIDIEAHPERARALIEKLSSLMRQTLITEGDDFISLGEELALSAAYLDIQKIRFGDRLDFEIARGDAPAAAQVPTLLLQPIIENAIKHGVAPVAEGGTVNLSATVNGDGLRLEVTNSARRLENRSSSGGLGLSNTAQRLEALFPGRHGFSYGRRNGCWNVTIELPLILIERVAG